MLVPKDERYQGVEKHSSGFKLLASMGWKEGEGLGAKRQGMKQHIKVRKNVENAGIGLAEARRRAGDWTVGMAAYDQVLAKLGSVSSATLEDTADPEREKSRKRKATSANDEKGSHDSAAAPTVKSSKKKSMSTGAPTEYVAATPMSRKASAAEAKLPEGRSTSVVAAVLPSAAEKTAAAKASHLARFGRRRAGKSVRSYSGSDLAAILGGKDSAAATPEESMQSPPDIALSRLVVDLADAAPPLQEGTDAQQVWPDDEEKWWYRTFVRSGRLGSAARKPPLAPSMKPKVKITGFSEDDQTNLYNMAHDASGKGRQGLGIASRSKKVAGARWQGTKKRLDNSSDDDEGQAAAAAAELAEQVQQEDSEGSEDTHVSSQAQPKLQSSVEQHPVQQHSVKQQSQQQDSRPEASAGEHAADVSAKKLVRCAKRVLKAAPGGQLRQKKLQKRVLDLLGLQRGSSARKHMCKALLAAVEASAKLKVSVDLVSL